LNATLIGDVGTASPGRAISCASSNRNHWILCPRYQPVLGLGRFAVQSARGPASRAGRWGDSTICEVSTISKPDLAYRGCVA